MFRSVKMSTVDLVSKIIILKEVAIRRQFLISRGNISAGLSEYFGCTAKKVLNSFDLSVIYYTFAPCFKKRNKV